MPCFQKERISFRKKREDPHFIRKYDNCLILDIVRSKIFKCIINPIIDSIKILKKEIG